MSSLLLSVMCYSPEHRQNYILLGLCHNISYVNVGCWIFTMLEYRTSTRRTLDIRTQQHTPIGSNEISNIHRQTDALRYPLTAYRSP